MTAYTTIGNWLFLIGSLLFTGDAVNNAWINCSMRSLVILVACCLFTTGCVFFLLDNSATANQNIKYK